MLDQRLTRVDATQLALKSPRPFPVRIFANVQVTIETAAVSGLVTTLDRYTGYIEQVAITPDIHKGAGIPIGTVLKTRGAMFPEAIGNDINCGMRLHTTMLDAAALLPRLDALETHARRLFFEGNRSSRTATCSQNLT